MKNQYDQTLEARLKVGASNITRMQILADEYGLAMDRAMMTKERLDFLTERLVGNRDQLNRQEFELAWETHVGTILDGVETEARKQALTDGA